MSSTPPLSRPVFMIGSHGYHADLSFSQNAIANQRLQAKARAILAQLAFGFAAFLAVGSFATLVLTKARFGAEDALLPSLLGLCCSGVVWCYAAYRRVVREDVVRAFVYPRDIRTPERTMGIASSAFTPLWNVTSHEARDVLYDAYLLACRMRVGNISVLHVFGISCGSFDVRMLFARLGISFETLQDALRHALQELPQGDIAQSNHAEICEVFCDAGIRAWNAHRPSITPLDLFASALARSSRLQEILLDKGITQDLVNAGISWMETQAYLRHRYEELRRASALRPENAMNRAMTARATPLLDAVCEDLTRQAAWGGLGIALERDEVFERMFRAISSGSRAIVLVGETGVGKMTILEELAVRMVEDRVPQELQDKRLLVLDIVRLLSIDGGARSSELLLKILEEAAASGNVILIIERIEELHRGSRDGAVDLQALVASEIDRGSLWLFGTLTPKAYKESYEQSALAAKTAVISLEEPSLAQATRMIQARSHGVEYDTGTMATVKTILRCAEFGKKFFSERALPESGLLLLKEAALLAKQRGTHPAWITEDDVARVVEEKTHVPVAALTKDTNNLLLHLEDALHERVIGQEEAVRAISSALRRARTTMRSQNRPIANFLFLGPTGVGKTELAKATAALFFSHEKAFLRFDMSEYQNKESLARLIGATGSEGILTESLRKMPYALVLFDELEKAHPDILNVFLQIMDDGRITDGTGRTVDCTNAILIATSNAGAQYIQDAIGQHLDPSVMKEQLMERELRAVYRPEFLNRFDDIVVFRPLTKDDVVAIAYLSLRSLAKRLEARYVNLETTDEGVHVLAERGYHPQFGARPLRRVLQDTLENALADMFLRGELQARDAVVLEKDGTLRIKKASAL